MKTGNIKRKKKPIIFLTFSNDKPGYVLYLRNLTKELSSILKVLKKAIDAGLCEVVVRKNATIEDILDVFQDTNYQDRIAIFHFAGHANGYKLLLESPNGGLIGAYREGVVSFLSHQKGLKFVFLNGCSSEQHALDLTQAGVPAVVGTSQLIDDEVAVSLSLRFYNGIANGYSLERAWKEAVDYIKTKIGPFNINALYYQGRMKDEDRFPWDIYYKKGGGNVKGWNLPEAANDPLFGLPDIPSSYGLPKHPYLFLKRYEKRHAKIFFGRALYIRRLYDKIIDPKSPPVILLYGQSGVGKSSLLDAGLIPRLEHSHVVIYARRTRQKNLVRTLQESLQNCFFEENEVKSTVCKSLNAKWNFIESKTKKNLIIILDQVEEVFSPFSKRLPNEFKIFLEALQLIFSERLNCPKGKLLLSYRKEYHPEIEKNFESYQLPRECLFLEPFCRKDIMAVVGGLTQIPELKQNYYNLEIEPDLPTIIADDLLEDKNSPLTPVLQILLTKMWHSATAENLHSVKFTVKMYQQFRKQGIAMDDFLRQQMETLKEWNSSFVDSGLALELLKYHTTELGTASIRSIENIRQIFQHYRDIDNLLQKLKELYLLTAVYSNKNEISLAHDILAPVVIREYMISDKPGQRASRILATKVGEFKRDGNKIKLDDVDLELVELGKKGMRDLNDDEKALLKISRQSREQREKERKRIKRVGVSLIIIIILAVFFAAFQWNSALNRARIAKTNYLASKAQMIALKNPTLALRIAEKARELDGNNETVRESIRKIYRENNFYKTIARHNDAVLCVSCSPNGDSILTSSMANTACLWDLKGNQLRVFKGHSFWIYSVAFSPDGQYILTGSGDNTARLWNLKGKQLKVFKHKNDVKAVSFSPDGRYILTGSSDDAAHLWDLQGNQLHLFKHTTSVESVTFSPDGKYILTGSYGGKIRVWNLMDKELKTSIRFQESLLSVVFSPDSNHILTCSEERAAYLWNLEGEKLQSFTGHQDLVASVAFSADGHHILTGSYDGTARLWNLKGEELHVFKGHEDSVTSACFSSNDKHIITGSMDKTLRLWTLKGREVRHFTNGSSIVSVAFSPNGNRILTSSYDRTTRFWNLKGELLQVFSKHKSGGFKFTPDFSPMALSPDGHYLLKGFMDGTVRLWDIKGKVLKTYEVSDKIITSVNFSPGGKYILIGSMDQNACLINLKGKKLRSFSGDDSIIDALFSPDGKNILTLSGYEKVQLWSLQGKKLQRFQGHDEAVRSIAFSSDSKNILTGSFDKTARLWDLQGKQLKVLRHESSVESVAFSKKTNYSRHTMDIVTGCHDGTIRIWDLQGNLLQIFRVHEEIVESVAFSPDGKYILSGSSDSTARLWPLLTSEDFLKNELCEKLTAKQLIIYGIKD